MFFFSMFCQYNLPCSLCELSMINFIYDSHSIFFLLSIDSVTGTDPTVTCCLCHIYVGRIFKLCLLLFTQYILFTPINQAHNLYRNKLYLLSLNNVPKSVKSVTSSAPIIARRLLSFNCRGRGQ